MDPVLVSRIQFGATIVFHYIFPQITIGLSVALVLMEALYLKTRAEVYRDLTKFWAGIFGLNFALGVVTGIPMEFQFGTNWAQYARVVGDVFGSALAAEGIFAFFLESGFLAVLLFGWDRVGPRLHFLATLMVCLGAHFSAIWIVVANSWMQTPAGHRIVGEGREMRAVTEHFWQVVFNPSSVERLIHTLAGAWQSGAFLVLSVSAFYLLRRRHRSAARRSFTIGLAMAAIAATGSIVSGHSSARGVAHHQPAKLAAMEGVYAADKPAGLHLFGWVDEQKHEVHGPEVPGLLSFLVHGDASRPVPGLDAVPPQDRPPVNRVFQAFHAMVAIGLGTFALTCAAGVSLLRGKLFERRWLLWPFVFTPIFVVIANELGWLTAEWGRQPWIVYGLMRTREGVSRAARPGQVWVTLVAFGVIYLLLFVLYIYLLNRKIQHGPGGQEIPHEDPLIGRQRADL